MIILLKSENRPITVEEQKSVIGCVITETEIKYYQQEDIDAYKEYLASLEQEPIEPTE
jgi:hypothetical protein